MAEQDLRIIENYYNFQQTVIVKTGKDIDEQKDFLGYEFSKRKRQEGIKINSYGGKLFDDSNYSNPQRANYYINQNILNN